MEACAGIEGPRGVRTERTGEGASDGPSGHHLGWGGGEHHLTSALLCGSCFLQASQVEECKEETAACCGHCLSSLQRWGWGYAVCVGSHKLGAGDWVCRGESLQGWRKEQQEKGQYMINITRFSSLQIPSSGTNCSTRFTQISNTHDS